MISACVSVRRSKKVKGLSLSLCDSGVAMQSALMAPTAVVSVDGLG
jgi:hypothetical protein